MFLFKWDIPASFSLFSHFSNNLQNKTLDFSGIRTRTRRWACWPLGHNHHGPPTVFLVMHWWIIVGKLSVDKMTLSELTLGTVNCGRTNGKLIACLHSHSVIRVYVQSRTIDCHLFPFQSMDVIPHNSMPSFKNTVFDVFD